MEKHKTLKDYLAAEKTEILGPDNMWFAGEKLDHHPSPSEAAVHFVKSGAAQRFAEKHVVANDEPPPQAQADS